MCGSGCIKFVFCFISLELHSEGSKLSGSSTVVPSPALNNPLAVKLLHVLVQRNKTECLLHQQKKRKWKKENPNACSDACSSQEQESAAHLTLHFRCYMKDVRSGIDFRTLTLECAQLLLRRPQSGGGGGGFARAAARRATRRKI